MISRRTLLKGAVATAAAPVLLLFDLKRGITVRVELKDANAEEQDGDTPEETPILFGVHAGGGWMHRIGADPGLIGGEQEGTITARYPGEDLIRQLGPHRWRVDSGMTKLFEDYGKQIAVFNGVHCPSNGHMPGTRATWTGSLQEEIPSILAMHAKNIAPELSTGFVYLGGDRTVGTLGPVTVIGGADDTRRLLLPNVIDPDKGIHLYRPNEIIEREIEFKKKLLALRMKKHYLPTRQEVLAHMLSIEADKPSLYALGQKLLSIQSEGDSDTIETLLTLIAEGKVKSVAFLGGGGFDTHGGPAQKNHGLHMGELFSFVHELWTRVIARGLDHMVLIVVGSEFGRTPELNQDGGADHWDKSDTVIMIGKKIRGATYGASDSGFYGLPVDPVTLLPNPDGVYLWKHDIQWILRELLGIDKKMRAQFPLEPANINVAKATEQLIAA